MRLMPDVLVEKCLLLFNSFNNLKLRPIFFQNLLLINGCGYVKSEIFGDYETFEGTSEYVIKCLENRILNLCSQIIESMFANLQDWYQDKPEIQLEILELYKGFKVWKEIDHE